MTDIARMKTTPDTHEVLTHADLVSREEHPGFIRLTYARDGRRYQQDVLPATGCAPYVTPLIRLNDR